MLGFGALRVMNDAIKHNREMLKAGKKDPFERDKNYRTKRETFVLKEKEYTPELITLIRATAKRQARVGQIRSITILIFSTIAAVFVFYFLYTNRFFW